MGSNNAQCCCSPWRNVLLSGSQGKSNHSNLKEQRMKYFTQEADAHFVFHWISFLRACRNSDAHKTSSPTTCNEISLFFITASLKSAHSLHDSFTEKRKTIVRERARPEEIWRQYFWGQHPPHTHAHNSIPQDFMVMKDSRKITLHFGSEICKLQICNSVYTWVHLRVHNNAVRIGIHFAQGSYGTWFHKLTNLHNKHICTKYSVFLIIQRKL